MLRKQIEVDARLVIVAFEKALRDERCEVSVPNHVRGQQRHVGFVSYSTVKAAARCDVGFATNDGCEPEIPSPIVKLHRAVHDAMVRKCYGGTSVVGGPLAEVVYAACAIQK